MNRFNPGGNGKPARLREKMVQGPGGLALPEHVVKQQSVTIGFLPKAWPGIYDETAYPAQNASEIAAWDCGTMCAESVGGDRDLSVCIYAKALGDLKRGQWCSIPLPIDGYRIAPLPPQLVGPMYQSNGYLCQPVCDVPMAWYAWYWCGGVMPECMREQP